MHNLIFIIDIFVRKRDIKVSTLVLIGKNFNDIFF